ncbi:relaxase/mobilization nuclease domain-containing protein [Paeniglutamicibacter sp. NPDC091659]|uniref:relaxase/mobilization nuclease domain-containing protein n=1 Tax=Paeniglutamicibacter sp. NPDC091659 TaxID=3364389 RepID=UPI0037FD584C
MIPNITRGKKITGVVRYLVDKNSVREGRTGNVHESPHVVGGDAFLQAFYGSEELDATAADEIAAYLDEPRKEFDVSVQERIREFDKDKNEFVSGGFRDAHVWHCSLSLPAEDGKLSNERWAEITQDFMDGMGFTEASGKAPIRWVAIHHGESANGNDHVHIAAVLVREDGTKASVFQDQITAQRVSREIEQKYGLTQVNVRGMAERGEKPAEQRMAKEAGLDRTAAKEIAGRVRSAAEASVTEDEWIRRVRQAGVVIKPRFARGSTDVVVGYSASLQPSEYGGRFAFYGGGKLGKDLSLASVRERFGAPTVDQAQAASREWQAAFRGQRPVETSGREMRQLKAEVDRKYIKEGLSLNERLSRTSFDDNVAWSRAAGDVSASLNAWAKFDPDNRKNLKEAADVLSKTAQYRPHQGERQAAPRRDRGTGTAMLFLQQRTGGKGAVAGQAMMRQMIQTASAISKYHRANRDYREAERVYKMAVEKLQAVDLTGYRQLAQPAPDVGKMSEAQRARHVSGIGLAPGPLVLQEKGAGDSKTGELLPKKLTRYQPPVRNQPDRGR